MKFLPRSAPLCQSLLVPVLMLCAPALVWAQYKVVLPDGSVTYTDRPPTGTVARVTPLRGGTAPAEAPPSGLPVELRQAAQRHPVTLYSAPSCTPCDGARRMLQQRGIPYSEKRVLSDEDIVALERLVGGRTVPSLNIGAQPLRGFSESEWNEYLDSAGYPRESKLPRGWKLAEVTPLVERMPVTATTPMAPSAPAPRTNSPQTAASGAPSTSTPGSIRF